MSQQFNSLSHKSSWLNTLFIFNSDFQSALTIILCLIFAAFNVSLPQLTSFSALSSIALLNIILLVFTYILLAKSDSNAPYLGLTFAMSFGSVMLFNLSQNMAFIGISVSILISPLTLWITQSYIHCLVSLFTQLINVILLFKLHFEEALKYMPTETISEKITLTLTLTCFGTVLMFGYFFHSQVKPIPIANLPSDSHNIDYPPNSLFDRQKLLISFILEVKALTETALGSLSLVSSHIEPGLGEKLVNIALASTENLQRTFDNIIEVDVKNLENHKIESKATNVKDLFNNAWKSMLLFIHKKELQGTLEVNDNLPEVIAIDSDKVSQLTRNLLDYFVRITSKGAVNVKVEMAEKRFETHAPEIAEFIIESTTNCVDQSFMSANCIKTSAKIQIFKPDARAERSLKVTIRNGVSENFEDDHGLIKGSVNEFLLASSQDELSKLNLYMSQRICESLGGKMAIYAKSESENAVVAYIPFKVFS